MASDTGAPWLLPYPEDTDLVRDGASDIEALAVATAAGLSIAGGLVAVKSAFFTGTSNTSTAAGGSFAVSGLTVTHALAEATNKLVISAYLGAAGSTFQAGNVGMSVRQGTTPLNVGASPGSRIAITAGGQTGGSSAASVVMPSATFVHAPGDTSSHVYTVRAHNLRSATQTIYINRTESDANSQNNMRTTSGLVIMEVRV
jgi:hypothetical protein